MTAFGATPRNQLAALIWWLQSSAISPCEDSQYKRQLSR